MSDGSCIYNTPRSRRMPTKCNYSVFDRFIPYRPCFNAEASYTKIFDHQNGTGRVKQPAQHQDPRLRYYKKLLDAVFKKTNQRIMAITQRPQSEYSNPMSPNRSFFTAPMDNLFAAPPRRKRRYVSKSPICVMDLPNIRNNFFTNNLDWGKSNKIAVALNMTTYVWDFESKRCLAIQLGTAGTDQDYITCVAWNPNGTAIAIADTHGDITVCDFGCSLVEPQPDLKKRSTISIIRWSENVFYSGDYDGGVCKYDPRVMLSAVTRFGTHHMMVCGLAVGPAGTPYFATGGGDGYVHIWDTRSTKVFRRIHAHTLLAKALAWCPWRKNVLASGGGCENGNIRLWNIHTGHMVGEISTQSQICGMLWSEEYHELVSSHGLTRSIETETNDLILWEEKDFTFEPVAKLQQHVGRPLHLSMSPDKTHIVKTGTACHSCVTLRHAIGEIWF
ncbi:uncharacterized protein [Argopecten irradians]|uniref:uncharacterized protein isoform X2 n=1 Tax=Argopecten irradians TaxID=31199 RepID=UPI00371A7AF8